MGDEADSRPGRQPAPSTTTPPESAALPHLPMPRSGTGPDARRTVPEQPRSQPTRGGDGTSTAPPMVAARVLLALIFVMLVVGLVYSYVLSLE